MDQYGVMTTVFVLHEVLSLLLSGKDKTACKADKMQPFVSSVFKRVLIMVDSEYVLKTVVSPSPSYAFEKVEKMDSPPSYCSFLASIQLDEPSNCALSLLLMKVPCQPFGSVCAMVCC